jgi:hypothetical protein
MSNEVSFPINPAAAANSIFSFSAAANPKGGLKFLFLPESHCCHAFVAKILFFLSFSLACYSGRRPKCLSFLADPFFSSFPSSQCLSQRTAAADRSAG